MSNDLERRVGKIEETLNDPESGLVPVVTVMRAQLDAQFALLKYGIPVGLTLLSLILLSIWGVHSV